MPARSLNCDNDSRRRCWGCECFLIDVFDGFGEAGLSEEVIETWREHVAEALVLGCELLRGLLECGEMGCGVAVAEGVIGDDVEALLEEGTEGAEVGVHAWSRIEWKSGMGILILSDSQAG